MKNRLLAAAILGTSGFAAAQSSITMFGVVDATVAFGKGSTSDRTQLSKGGTTTPRIGFRGTEDLGSGMYAGFWLEAAANTDDGTGGATNTNNQTNGTGTAIAGSQGLTFARRSTVSLGGKWGELRLGRDFIPQYLNLGTMDALGNVGVGTAVNYAYVITAPMINRASNSVAYFTPADLGGFYGSAMYYLGENASNAANSKDGTGAGIRVGWAGGPFNVAVATGRTKYVTGDVQQSNIAGEWNAGVARVMGGYGRDRNGALRAEGWAVGTIVPVGVGELKASYSQYEMNSGSSPQSRKVALGYVHNLSKRTALYTTLAHLSNRGPSALALNGATTGPGQSSRGLDLGLRHSF